MSVREILAGRAVVELGLKNNLESALKSVRARLTRFGGSLKSLGSSFAVGGAAMTGFAAAAISPLVAAAKSFSDFGDSIQKMAVRTGMSTEALSELSFAAGQSGTDLATVEKGVSKMQRSITDATQGMKGAQDTISNLGLDLQQLSAMSPEEQFMAVGKAIAGIADPTQRAGMAMQMFGKSGTQLLPLLTDDITKLRDEAKELGFTLSEEDANAAAGLNDAFGRLTSTVTAAWLKIGAAIAPAFTAGVNIISRVASVVTRWIDKNRSLFVAIAAVAAIIGVLGAALMAAGVTIFAIGTAIAALAPIISTIFSPVGAIIGVLIAAGTAAYYFRDALWQLLLPLAPLFKSLQSLVMNFGSIFGQTFGAVVAALGGGNLAAAGQIAMAGLTAAFWQGLSDLTNVFNAMLDMLESWLPGFDAIRDAAATTFASISNSIMAGRWDLAGAIIMAKLKLAILSGWNSIKFIWTATTIGLAGIFETMGASIRSSWRTMIFGLAKWILWLGEKLGLLDKGAGKMIEQMQAEAQTADDKAVAKREAARYATAQEQLDRARAGETDLKNQITSLESEAGAAAANAPTLEERATTARSKLDRLTAPKPGDEEAQPLVDANKLDQLKAASANGQKAVGKLASTGTFSAAAAATMGIGTKPMEETARNTAALLSVAKKQLKQKPPAAVFGT